MEQIKISKRFIDQILEEMVLKTSHKNLGIWARECALRVLPYFENDNPDDKRPRQALDVLENWIDTQKFSMRVIRKASLDSHKAAKDIGNNSAAASVAHACGQAVATAHVPRHALGSALYAIKAIQQATDSEEKVQKELEWQRERLLSLLGEE